MSDDFAGGAVAPAETNTVAAEPVNPPAPIQSEPPKAETKPEPEPKVEEKKGPTAREALKAAAEKVAEKAKADEGEKKAPPVQSKAADKALPDPKPAKAGETATVEAKPAETAPKAPHHEMPARFKSDAAATAEWEKAPEAVKAAVHRSFRELEAGIEKHKSAAEEFEKVKDFHDLATKNNTTLRDAMTRYTNFERTILQNPIQGLQQVCDYAGISLRDVAAHIMGQKPDEVQGQNDATIQQLKREIETLKQSVTGVTTNIQQQHVATIDAQVQKFAADHPRFEELAEDVAFFLKSGKTKDLAEAYSLAERLNHAPATIQAAPQTRTAPDPQAQTLKGQKSVTGAPSAGSDPATKRASTSIKDSLRRAVAQTG